MARFPPYLRAGRWGWVCVAGIGKSRLTAALLERLASEPHMRLRYFCSPQHTDSAFYPIIGQMERAAELLLRGKPSVICARPKLQPTPYKPPGAYLLC